MRAKTDIDVGELRYKILIQSRDEIEDETGGNSGKWYDQGYIYAAFMPHKAWEIIRTMQLTERLFTRVTIRYNKAINSKMRFIFRNRIYFIRGVIDKEAKNHWLELICEMLDTPYDPALEPNPKDGILNG